MAVMTSMIRLVLLFLMAGSALAQSSFPTCQGSDVSRWTNCFGSSTLANGGKYFGEWYGGARHGQGTTIFVDGDKYVGEYKNDQRDGQGAYENAKAKIIHVGGWKENYREGDGIEYKTDGTVVKSGNWKGGVLLKNFEIDINRFPLNSINQPPDVSLNNPERDRLNAEVQAARIKVQDLEAQLIVQQQPSQGLKRNTHALVIGNGAYPGSGRLDNPVNDANAISQKLRSMGFTVTTVTDANRQKLVQSMAQFRRTAAAADISLLFYAGHGVQIFGTNYILPTDVDQTDPAQATIQGVSLNSVVENFLPGKTKLVFLDACRDNALQRTNDRSVSKGLAPISAAEGTLISYATKDGQTAADGVGSKNSPFTQALLEHINDPQDIAVVLRKVREKVMKATGGKQQPWEYGSLTGGELVLSAIRPK
jgi:hypothetical protein